LNSLHLILLKGHPATGKSTLAQALAQRLGWPLVDKDDIKDFVANFPGGNSLAYDIVWRIVERQLGLGISTIVDTPLSYPIGYDMGRRLVTNYSARLLVVETVLDEHVWRQRLEDRRPYERSTHRISSWCAMQTLLAQYNGCWQYFIEPDHYLCVDTSGDLTTGMAKVLERLGIVL
jgi:predicted kinase